RASRVEQFYFQSELELLDIKTQSEAYNLNIDCTNSIQENIDFGDKIYAEAKKLEKYDESSRLSDSIKLQHKKYDILRVLFWINTMKIKKACNASYSNIVYFYDYDNPSLEQAAMQRTFSNSLESYKQKKGNSIILIPIAADNNITSVDIFLKRYDITSLPTILINEKTKITSINELATLV
ncbi:MAG: hypothetical protein AABX71_02460, partial [Nanoarchaeota archaeon]